MRHLVFLLVVLCVTVASGQYEQGQYDLEDEDLYPTRPIPPDRADLRWVIDVPTAGMLPRGAFDIDFRTFPEGGVQVALGIGLSDKFAVGIGYGGARILSADVPEWNPRLEFKIRYRLVEETESFPALALGYSSQGYGLYEKEDMLKGYYEDRYLVKSPGFYMSLSKNYTVQSTPLGWHGGINYSFENKVDGNPNFFVGVDVGIGYDMLFLAEYDLAINDNKRAGIFGMGRGYLNLGLAWFITSGISLEIDFRNLLLNRDRLDDEKMVIDREVRLIYMQFFSE